MVKLTLTVTGSNEGETLYNVKRGVTFLATVDFGGPRGTLRTHDGTLYADERKQVYALKAQAEAR